MLRCSSFLFFFQAEDGIRDVAVTGVQTCALPILRARSWEGTLPAALPRTRSQPLPPTKILRLVFTGDDWRRRRKIGRASCRERGEISVVAVSLKKKKEAIDSREVS